MSNFYKILGVSKNATQETIKTAYRNLAKRFHPDVNKSKEAEQKFKEITAAYQILGDVKKRFEYDAQNTIKNMKEGTQSPFGEFVKEGMYQGEEQFNEFDLKFDSTKYDSSAQHFTFTDSTGKKVDVQFEENNLFKKFKVRRSSLDEEEFIFYRRKKK